MMLALVNNEREMRRDIRMIIRPLSDEFIHGSPESQSADSYRLESGSTDSVHFRPARLEREGEMV